MTRAQLVELGYSAKAIEHRISTRRLHPVARGVYAVGRAELTRRGQWMAAVLSCGPDAVLSHGSAGVLWEILEREPWRMAVSVPAGTMRRRPGLVVHRRDLRADDITRHHGIPVTTPISTLVDLAARLPPERLEAAVNAADKHDLVDPEALRRVLEALPRRPGVAALRTLLDRHTFALTDSELERRFMRLVRRAGLPQPRTGCAVNGFKVDFYWADLALVVETDGLRYHRTAAQQARDAARDQTQAAAGLTPLRFTHSQVCFEPSDVEATLAAVAGRLQAG